MDACHRSTELGDRYSAIVDQARERIGESIALDQSAGGMRDDVKASALADLLAVFALGVVAALELDIALDLPRLGHTMKQLVRTQPSRI